MDQVYICKNPVTGSTVNTAFMWEADFWCSLGYEIHDYYFKLEKKHF